MYRYTRAVVVYVVHVSCAPVCTRLIVHVYIYIHTHLYTVVYTCVLRLYMCTMYMSMSSTLLPVHMCSCIMYHSVHFFLNLTEYVPCMFFAVEKCTPRAPVFFIGLSGIGCNRLFLLHCKWLLVRNTEEV